MTVLITGASSGIGAAIAEVYAEMGKSLYLLARRQDRLDQVAQKCRERGASEVRTLCVDVTNEEQVQQALDACAAELKSVDVVYANAGFGVTQTFDQLTNEDFRRQFETNIFGVLNTARSAMPHLEKSAGKLAIVGSVSSYVNTPTDSPYSMSKSAVRALSDTLYLEWQAKGISVTFVAPGFVTSEIRHKNNDETLNADQADPAPKRLVMDTRTAARQIVAGVEARRREIVITAFGKFIVWLRRVFPSLAFLLVGYISRNYDRARK